MLKQLTRLHNVPVCRRYMYLQRRAAFKGNADAFDVSTRGFQLINGEIVYWSFMKTRLRVECGAQSCLKHKTIRLIVAATCRQSIIVGTSCIRPFVRASNLPILTHRATELHPCTL